MSNSNLALKIPAMAVGVAGAALSAYSVVVDGNAKARCETKEELGEKYVDMYVKNLSSSRESHLLEKLKHYVMKQKLDNSFFPCLLQTKNHVVNWIGETVENIVPIALSAIAIGAPILLKKPKINTNIKSHIFYDPAVKTPLLKRLSYLPYAEKLGTKIAAISAGLLLLGSGKYFLHDIWGLGKSKEH